MNASQKVFKPTPPQKGSFPLDHDGDCKEFMKRYMTCLRKNQLNSIECVQESKSYLNCRMENGLMEKEKFTRLGFKKEQIEKEEN